MVDGRRNSTAEKQVDDALTNSSNQYGLCIHRMNMTTKQFQLLSDVNLVWDFLVDIYDRENGGGMPAPFFEHALQSSWMDLSYTFLDRLWFDGDKVVAFVYYESPMTDIYFNVRKGYEFLADELIDYAMTTMPNWNNQQQLIFFNGQEFL